MSSQSSMKPLGSLTVKACSHGLKKKLCVKGDGGNGFLPEHKKAVSLDELKEQIKRALQDHPNLRTKEISGLFSSSGHPAKEIYHLVLEVKRNFSVQIFQTLVCIKGFQAKLF